MRRAAIRTFVAMSLLIVPLVSAPAAGQNGQSFAGVASSTVEYELPSAHPQRTCESLVSLTGYEYSIVSADLVPTADEVPEHCRVSGLIPPEIRFEINLPSGWNRRLYMHGNGGFAGTSPGAPQRVAARGAALRHGFATAYTDTGHDSRVEPLATFAHDNLAKVIDFGFRAVHLTAVTAKTVVAAYYDGALTYSYFDGCSTGGRQGLMSAQRFPADFDGIVVGAPVLDFTGTMIWNAWNAHALDAASLELWKVGVLGEAVYAACDDVDGLADGLIDDPRRCEFDPERALPLCSDASNGDRCFSAADIQALERIYGGVVRHGDVVFPGLPVGAEARGAPTAQLPNGQSGWARWIVRDVGRTMQLEFADSFMKYMAFDEDDPDYDWRTFDFDEDPARMTSIRQILDATDPDLAPFRDRGGKILSYFGWADPALNPLMGVDYYEDVRETMGPATDDFYRLFMVPGMFHCRGGRGTDRFDAMTPLIEWVEGDRAPDQLTASRIDDGVLQMTRPLCPYPEVARYDGTGNPNEADSFRCVAP